MPALDIAIHDVVVQQREVVDQLDRDRGRNAVSRAAAARLGGQYGQRRSDGFAADAVSGDRLTVCVEPPEVVRGDPAHVVAVEAIDGGPQRGKNKGTGAAEDRGRLDTGLDTDCGIGVNKVEDTAQTLGGAKLIHVVARHVV